MLNSSSNEHELGFSLTEIIVAFGILSLGLVTLAGTFPFALKINKESENQSSASYIAQEKLEELISMPYSEIATGTIETRSQITGDRSSDFYYFTRETVVNFVDIDFNSTTTDLGLKKITINTYYINSIGRNEKKISSFMLISRRQ